MKDGVAWGCGVTMDGQTGEILMTNVITGGNDCVCFSFTAQRILQIPFTK